MALLLGALSVAWSFAAPAADNRFHEQRARLLQQTQEAVTVRGRVVGSRGDDRLLTNISPLRLAKQGVGDLDQVWIHIAGKSMVARIMNEATFQSLMGDQAAMESLDVDVVCLVRDRSGNRGMEIVGLGGGLVPWIQPSNKMPVTLEKVLP